MAFALVRRVGTWGHHCDARTMSSSLSANEALGKLRGVCAKALVF